jgi:hypothetical protein
MIAVQLRNNRLQIKCLQCLNSNFDQFASILLHRRPPRPTSRVPLVRASFIGPSIDFIRVHSGIENKFCRGTFRSNNYFENTITYDTSVINLNAYSVLVRHILYCHIMWTGPSRSDLIGLVVTWSFACTIPTGILIHQCIRRRMHGKVALEPQIASRFGQAGYGVRVLLILQASCIALTLAALAFDRWSIVSYDADPDPTPAPTPDGDGDGDEIIVWECGLFGVYLPGSKNLVKYTCASPATEVSELKCFDQIATGALVFAQALFSALAGLITLYNLAGPTCDGSIASHQSLAKSAGWVWLTALVQPMLLLSSTVLWAIVSQVLDTRRVPYTSFILNCCGFVVSLVLVVSLRRFLERLPPLVLPPKMILRATRSMFETTNQVAPVAPTSRSGAPAMIQLPQIDGFSTSLAKPPVRSSLSIVSKPYRASLSRGPNSPSVAFAAPSTQIPRLSVPSSATNTHFPPSAMNFDPPSPCSSDPSGRKSNSIKFSATPDLSTTPPTSSDGSSSSSLESARVRREAFVIVHTAPTTAATAAAPPTDQPHQPNQAMRFCSKCGVGAQNAKANLCAACGSDVLV